MSRLKLAEPDISLHSGDRMGQPEFHARYRRHPDDARIELIGGTVFVASPVTRLHGLYHEELGFLLGLYRRNTPGVELTPDTTAILGDQSEPRPDLPLRLPREYGGQSHVNAEGYIVGPPEFVAEVAYSSRALDLNHKRDDYLAAGVQEYLVLDLEGMELHWFHFPSKQTLRANRQGVRRSRVFPGLWVDGPALIRRDSAALGRVLDEGLAGRGHAAFVRRLRRFSAG